jgi:hypothetical protein
MQPNAADRLVAHVLATAGELSLAARAQLYRDTAELIASEDDARTLNALARDCDAVARNHAQLVLDFKRRAS